MLGEGDGGNFVKSYNNLQHSVTKPKCGQFVTMGVERELRAIARCLTSII